MRRKNKAALKLRVLAWTTLLSLLLLVASVGFMWWLCWTW